MGETTKKKMRRGSKQVGWGHFNRKVGPNPAPRTMDLFVSQPFFISRRGKKLQAAKGAAVAFSFLCVFWPKAPLLFFVTPPQHAGVRFRGFSNLTGVRFGGFSISTEVRFWG